MGAILDLPSHEWFGDYDPQVTVHIIDSSRPQNLATLFGTGENGDRVIIWDDGGAEKLEEEREAWEAIMVCSFDFDPPQCLRTDVRIYSLIRNLTQTRIRTCIPMMARRVMRMGMLTSTSTGMTRNLGKMVGPGSENPSVSRARGIGNDGG